MGPTRIMDDVKPIITEVLLASAGVIKYVSFLFSGVLNFLRSMSWEVLVVM